MDSNLFVMLMEIRHPVSMDVVARHVEHLKMLDKAGSLVMCGPFLDNSGGMVVLQTATREEADAIALSDPFIAEGYKTYELHTWQVADADNRWLLD
ncbi:MAG: YciI family protein [Propionibacteriaceae bacterium]|jgi:uncharacterized protein YciI|nr:YciI family protein [Propionibacteriaceae bacterium]